MKWVETTHTVNKIGKVAGAQARVLLTLPGVPWGTEKIEVLLKVYPSHSPIDGPIYRGEALMAGYDLVWIDARTLALAKRRIISKFKALLKKSLSAIGKL